MSYRSTVLALCLLLPLSVPAADSNCNLIGVGKLPVTMSGSQPLISGTINGIEARFVLDTSADSSHLWEGAIEKYRLKPIPSFDQVMVHSLGGSFVAKIASAKRFSLNGFGVGEIKKVRFLVGGDGLGLNVDGVIGQNIIGTFDAEYDLANGVIRLFSAKGCENQSLAYWVKTGPVAVMAFDPNRSKAARPITSARLNGNDISVLFNSGAWRSMLTRSAASRIGIEPGDEGVVQGGISFGANHGRVNTWIARFDTLDLGGEQIRNARLTIADMQLSDGTDLMLGVDFFLSHRVYIARGQNKIYFTYNGGRVFDLGTSEP